MLGLILYCSMPLQANAAGTSALVVVGIGGNEQYTEQFNEHGQTIATSLASVASDENGVELLSGEESTRENIVAAIERIGTRNDDLFMLVFIGHGTADSSTWRFNIPGSDIDTAQLVAALNTVNARQQLVVLSTSASGAVLNILDQPGRVVVTATKSAGEVNAVRFSEYFAKALDSSVADIDRNEILTLAEVWRYANEQTQNLYKDMKLLASEHARLRGDRPASIAMSRLGALREARDDPAVAVLLDERLLLEDEFAHMLARKPDMNKADFYTSLEPLLLKIARLQQKIDVATGWDESDE